MSNGSMDATIDPKHIKSFPTANNIIKQLWPLIINLSSMTFPVGFMKTIESNEKL